MLEIKFTPSTNLKKKPDKNTPLGFGKIFTDYMFLMDYDNNKWHDARIVPYGPFTLDPSTAVFHYAQEIFEGLKAYRSESGIKLFRPDCNAKRFINSAKRLNMPPIAEEDFIQACSHLAKVEKDWIFNSPGTSLYLRPFMIATGVGLGVHASSSYRFCIIASPSDFYYKNGLKPIRIYVEDEYIRSAPGLTGFAKCGGNYAASIYSSELAKQLGYDQVLWLDGIHHKYIEEVGSMNIFFIMNHKVYTAPCNGTVLSGVTRLSVIELLKDRGYEILEEQFSLEDVLQAERNHQLQEVFGSGTAAVISPIGELAIMDQHIIINNNQIGPITSWLYQTLTDIQWSKSKIHSEWSYLVK